VVEVVAVVVEEEAVDARLTLVYLMPFMIVICYSLCFLPYENSVFPFEADLFLPCAKLCNTSSCSSNAQWSRETGCYPRDVTRYSNFSLYPARI